MANWNYGGYTAPSTVTSKDDVRALQRQLGVTADGLWGPKTQAAYERSGMGAQASSAPQSSVPSGYSSYLKDFQSLLTQHTPTLSYTPQSREQLQADISAALRPGYDLAISQRKKATETNKANIDVDAASRGMGSSTWVTDVKDRAMDSEAEDIATLESQYAAAQAQMLMEALQQDRANQLAVDQYNASNQAAALQTALGLAGDFYANDLAMAQQMSKGSGGSGKKIVDDEYAADLQAALGGGSAVTDIKITNPTVTDWTQLLKDVTADERREILYGTTTQGKAYQNQLVSELGESALGRYRRYYG